MKLPALGILLILFYGSCTFAVAAPKFPELSARVVDQVGLLSSGTRESIEQVLAQHEQETSNQVVVVILKTLDGYDIADYGYQLGRYWGIGQEQRNNGALLIVVPDEKKVRIEVGYGLEGDLTDAMTHDIIHSHILPRFRLGDFEGGVIAGVKSILSVIAHTYQPLAEQQEELSISDLLVLLLFLLFIYFSISGRGGRGGGPGARRGVYYPGGFGGGFGGSGGFGGGFGGGGGGFGGGGASGSW